MKKEITLQRKRVTRNGTGLVKNKDGSFTETSLYKLLFTDEDNTMKFSIDMSADSDFDFKNTYKEVKISITK